MDRPADEEVAVIRRVSHPGAIQMRVVAYGKREVDVHTPTAGRARVRITLTSNQTSRHPPDRGDRVDETPGRFMEL